MRLALLLLLTAGCRQIFGLDAPGVITGDGPKVGQDSGFDDAFVTDAPSLCFSRPDIQLSACLAALPTNQVVVPSNTTIDSTNSAYCATLTISSEPMCVVAGTSVTVPSNVTARVIGTRPVVVFSTGAIDIEGTIDVASHLPASGGAGAGDSSCGTTEAGVNNSGGAGGSFTTAGGDGARGATVNGQPGIARPAIAISSFHGGCPGGLGSLGTADASSGGGAIALIARSQITVGGLVDASGGGGTGASTPSHGGYGGGAGGMIVLVAPNPIAGGGTLRANGGGGGGGANQGTVGVFGGEGANPMGGPGANGGDGGGGFPLDEAGQIGLGTAGGGGGGGGGAGAIVVFSPSSALTSSPATVVHAF